jgi:hypothetical protein
MSNSKPVINFITTNSRNDYSRNYKVVLTLTNGMIHIESETYQRTFGYMYRNTRNSLSYKEVKNGVNGLSIGY